MKIEDLDPYQMIDFDEWQEIVDLRPQHQKMT